MLRFSNAVGRIETWLNRLFVESSSTELFLKGRKVLARYNYWIRSET